MNSSKSSLEPLLTADEVGDILKLPRKSVYDLPIPKVRIGMRRVRFKQSDVDEFICRRTTEE